MGERTFEVTFEAFATESFEVTAENAEQARERAWKKFGEDILPAVDPWDLRDVEVRCEECGENYDPDDDGCLSCEEMDDDE